MTIKTQLKESAEFFLRKKTLVHIKTRTAFYNGYILEVYADKIIINDRLFGEIVLLYSEIFRIEPYKFKQEKLI